MSKSSLKPIAVQLYSLRQESEEDFDSVLQDVARTGYVGVEPFHLFGKTPQEFARQVADLGMKISSSHYPWAHRTDPSEVVDIVKAMGLNRAAGGFGPDDFSTRDSVKRTVDRVNTLVQRLNQDGVELFLHNHWFEFEPVEGEIPFHKLYRECPGVLFEVDTYWAANFGNCDPIKEVRQVRDRAPLLHIKDGPNRRGHAHVAVGQGLMDIRGIVEAADPSVLEWLIVELDECATSMQKAIEESYHFLVSEGLGRGQ